MIYKISELSPINNILLKDINQEQINNLIKHNIPFKLKSATLLTCDKNKFVESIFNLNDLIQISVSSTSKFSGNFLDHNVLDMTYEDFRSYKGNLKLYFSQFNLLKKLDGQELFNLIKIGKLFEILSINNFSRINIWESYSETLSKYHYDSYQNLLYVIKGIKHVSLIPNNSSFIRTYSLGESCGNQAKSLKNRFISKKRRQLLKYTLMHEEREIINSYKKYSKWNEQLIKRYKNLVQKIADNFTINLNIHEDEILFIPEGWYHQVYSKGEHNLALNFWWDKSNLELSNNNEKFLIRQSLESLVNKKIKNFENCGEIFLSLNNDNEEEFINKIRNMNYREFAKFYNFLEKIAVPEKINKMWDILEKHNERSLIFDKISQMKQQFAVEILNSLNIFDNIIK